MEEEDYFRPRLGIGWFQKIIFKGAKSNDFRPRLGVGWFPTIGVSAVMTDVVFVPEWGWVGSI